MSRENVEFVRSIYACWEGGDFSSNEWAHPEIEYVVADGPVTGTWHGLAGMAEAMRDWLSVWQEWRVETDRYLDLDDELVLVLFHFTARGRASGLEVGQIWTEGATLFHLRDGRVTRLVQYLDRERAFEAVGLSE